MHILKLKQSIPPFQNEPAFDEVFQNANFRSYVFRSRVKLETYNVSRAEQSVAGPMQSPVALLLLLLMEEDAAAWSCCHSSAG